MNRYVWLIPVLACLAWLGLIEPARAPAQSCGSYSYRSSYTSYRPARKAYDDVVIVPRFVAILADLPSYSAVYTPPVVAVGAPPVAGAVQPGVAQVQPGVAAVPGAPAIRQPGVPAPPQPAQPSQSVPGKQVAPQQPPPAAAPVPPCEATLKAVVDTLARINARLDRLEGMQRQGYVPPPPPQPPPQRRNGEEGPPPGKDDNGEAKAPPGGQPGYAKCAVCHEASKAVDEGGGFVMFNGQLRAQLTSGQKVKMARKLRRGEMPPVDNKHKITPITSEEYDALAESFGF